MISAQHHNELIFKTMIDQQGILTAQLPEFLRGKIVTIQISPAEPQNALFDLFAEADTLTFPRRHHEDILKELRTVRECE